MAQTSPRSRIPKSPMYFLKAEIIKGEVFEAHLPDLASFMHLQNALGLKSESDPRIIEVYVPVAPQD